MPFVFIVIGNKVVIESSSHFARGFGSHLDGFPDEFELFHNLEVDEDMNSQLAIIV